MTPIDLRIEYKLQTGNYPTRERNFASHSQTKDNDENFFTQDYVNWLGGRNKERQLYYKKDTGFLSLYYDSKPTDDYVQWLEDVRLEVFTVLEDLRK